MMSPLGAALFVGALVNAPWVLLLIPRRKTYHTTWDSERDVPPAPLLRRMTSAKAQDSARLYGKAQRHD